MTLKPKITLKQQVSLKPKIALKPKTTLGHGYEESKRQKTSIPKIKLHFPQVSLQYSFNERDHLVVKEDEVRCSIIITNKKILYPK